MKKTVRIISVIVSAALALILCACAPASSSSSPSSQSPSGTSESSSFNASLEAPGLPEGTQAVNTELAHPAKPGQWALIARESMGEDGGVYPCYLRITSVTRGGEETAKLVADYNAGGFETYFTELDANLLEYCLVRYEIFFPADYPEPDYGITELTVPFTVTSDKGDAFEHDGKIYEGLNSVYDISPLSGIESAKAGETYSGGMAVFAMLNGFDNFVLKSSYTLSDKTVSLYLSPQ